MNRRLMSESIKPSTAPTAGKLGGCRAAGRSVPADSGGLRRLTNHSAPLTSPLLTHSSPTATGDDGEDEARNDGEKRRTTAKRGENWGVGLSAGRSGGAGRGGYGGQGGGERGRRGTERGGGRQTRSGVVIGSVVRNVSGRGVWGKGTVVGVVPGGVNPRWYCRRHGLPNVFGRRSEAVWRERYVVMGADGRLHIPREVELAKEV